jgi:hypothetical protein
MEPTGFKKIIAKKCHLFSDCFGPGTRTLDILHVDVQPAKVCAATSGVLGGGLMFLTLTTAGVASTFDLVLKDEFGNIRDNNDDVVALALAVRPGGRYFSSGAQSVDPTFAFATAGDPSGRYRIEYRVTFAGQYWMSVSAGDSSNTGLSAQYFTSSHFIVTSSSYSPPPPPIPPSPGIFQTRIITVHSFHEQRK